MTATSVHAIAMPVAAPSVPNMALSTNAWRNSRPRDAPRAEHIANSRRREVKRSSSRLLTFAHKTRNTRRTPPVSSGTAPVKYVSRDAPASGRLKALRRFVDGSTACATLVAILSTSASGIPAAVRTNAMGRAIASGGGAS